MSFDADFSRYHSKPEIKHLGVDVAPKVFQLLGVSPEMNEFLRILDRDEDLILVHYIELIPSLFHIRGTVIDLNQMKIVGISFPHTPEYEIEEIKHAIRGFSPPYFVNYTHEGTIVRLFYAQEQWYFSIHKKLNGRRSRWSGPTFGDIFDQLWGDVEFDEVLDRNNCYVFLLSHPDNRLVSPIPEPSLSFICAFERKENQMKINRDITFQHSTVKFPSPELEVENIEELKVECEKLDWKLQTGLLICQETEDNKLVCAKIVPSGYTDRRNVRENEPNFRLRYLHLLQNRRGYEIRDMFPEKLDIFDSVDKDLEKVPGFLASYYRKRYQEKQYIMLPQELHYVLEATRKRFNKSKSIEDNIRNQMKYSNGRQLNAIIRFMKNPTDELNVRDD